MAVYRDHDHEIDQGDVLVDVPFVFRRGESVEVKPRLGVVTSHGCDCERYTRRRDQGADDVFLETYTVQVAPLIHTVDFDAGVLGDIRRGRVRKYFAIPADDEHPEVLIDLHLEQPVPVAELLDLHRETSLSDETWAQLVVHQFVLQSRLNPDDVFRPEVLP